MSAAEQAAETAEAVERIAAAVDAVAEDFMDRYRRRPHGSGDGLYDIADAFSSFADAVRYPPGKRGAA